MVTVMEMVMMMIPMKSSSMTVTMAMFSSLREGISLADFSLPESFSLSVVFRPAEAAKYFCDPSLCLRVSGGMKYVEGEHQRWARASSPHLGTARGGPRLGMVRAHGGPPPALLLAPSVFG